MMASVAGSGRPMMTLCTLRVYVTVGMLMMCLAMAEHVVDA